LVCKRTDRYINKVDYVNLLLSKGAICLNYTESEFDFRIIQLLKKYEPAMQFLENGKISKPTEQILKDARERISETFNRDKVVKCSICHIRLDCDYHTQIQKKDNLLAMLPCNHFFHIECCNNYMKSNITMSKKNYCPLHNSGDDSEFNSENVFIFPFGLYHRRQTSVFPAIGTLNEERDKRLADYKKGGKMRSKRKTHKKMKPRKTQKKKIHSRIKTKSLRRRR